LIRPWLTPEPDQQFDEKVEDINTLYQRAPELVRQGERVLSTDELTGVQALERKHPGLPLAPGKVERQEFEYIRPLHTQARLVDEPSRNLAQHFGAQAAQATTLEQLAEVAQLGRDAAAQLRAA